MDRLSGLNGVPESVEEDRPLPVMVEAQITDDESEESDDDSEAASEEMDPSDPGDVRSNPSMLSVASAEEPGTSLDGLPTGQTSALSVEPGENEKKTRKKTKHNWYSIPEINRIMAAYRDSKMSRRKFCSLMKVPESSLRRWETRPIPKGEPARRTAKYPDIEKEVQEWYKAQKAKQRTVTNLDLRHKAQEIAMRDNVEGFDASPGWVNKLKERRKIKTADTRFSSFKETSKASSKSVVVASSSNKNRDEVARTVKSPKKTPKAKYADARKSRLILPKVGKAAMSKEKVQPTIKSKPIQKEFVVSTAAHQVVAPRVPKFVFMTTDH